MATGIYDYFFHNWVTEAKLVTRYATDVTAAYATLAEERIALTSIPFRTLTLRWTGISQEEAHRILNHLTRAAYQRIYIPLYMDQSLMTADSSGTTINCDATNRRFQTGKEVLLLPISAPDDRYLWNTAQRRTLAAVGTTTLTTTAALTGTLKANQCLVFPLTLWEIRLESITNFITDEKADVTVSFDEVPGLAATGPPTQECIDPLTEQGTSSHTGYGFAHIFGASTATSHEHNWLDGLEVTVVRAGSKVPHGRWQEIATQGARPQREYTLRLDELNRTDAYYLIRYFDSKRGRAIPFFLPSPHRAFTFTAINFTYVDILPIGNIDDIRDFVEHVCFWVRGNVPPFSILPLFVNKISSVDDNGATWRINFSDLCVAAIVASLVTHVSIANFVRFAEDAMEEVWRNDGNCLVRLPPMREILAEQQLSSITITPP